MFGLGDIPELGPFTVFVNGAAFVMIEVELFMIGIKDRNRRSYAPIEYRGFNLDRICSAAFVHFS